VLGGSGAVIGQLVRVAAIDLRAVH
jgi:hypothetical protein